MGRELEQGLPYLAAVLSHVNRNARGDTNRHKNTHKKNKPPWNSSFWVTYRPKFPVEGNQEGVKRMDRPGRVPSKQCLPLIMPNVRVGAEYVPDNKKIRKATGNDKPEDKYKRMHAQREKAAKDRALARQNFPRFTKEQELLCDQLRDRYDQVCSSLGRPHNGLGGLRLNANECKDQARRLRTLTKAQTKVHTVRFCASPPELSKMLQQQISEPPDRSMKKLKTLRQRAPPMGGITDRSRGDPSKRKAYEEAQSILQQEVSLSPSLMFEDAVGVPQEEAQLQELIRKRHEEIDRLARAATQVNCEEKNVE